MRLCARCKFGGFCCLCRRGVLGYAVATHIALAKDSRRCALRFVVQRQRRARSTCRNRWRLWKRLTACLQPATRIAKTATHLGFTFSNFVASRTWFAPHLAIVVAPRCALAVDFERQSHSTAESTMFGNARRRRTTAPPKQ